MSSTKTAKKSANRKTTRGAKAAPSKKAPATKATAKPKATPADGKAKAKKLSAIDAAAKVLADAKGPMNAKEMIDAMAAKGLWKSPGGKTPHATLYSAILREINAKGKEVRFKKTERGKFVANR
ncbi:MAG TPA: HTH domain-containing protein [Lacipirellulaceae bacterium]|nr:HTH domain-containing protein [Lacipirellulaceae bacterium]HMP08108.1 HTH domain-containing protein [Lacipirellulaceae bacterium]